MNTINIKRYDTPNLKENEEQLSQMLRNSPIPDAELLKILEFF